MDVPAVDYKTHSSKELAEDSATIPRTSGNARAVQREGFQSERGVHSNAAMTPSLIRKHCELDSEASGYLEHAMIGQNFNARITAF